MNHYVCLYILAERATTSAKIMEDRPARLKTQTTAFMGGLPDVLRKPRKKLTPEELEQRSKQVDGLMHN